jgi:hypothetical protein
MTICTAVLAAQSTLKKKPGYLKFMLKKGNPAILFQAD